MILVTAYDFVSVTLYAIVYYITAVNYLYRKQLFVRRSSEGG